MAWCPGVYNNTARRKNRGRNCCKGLQVSEECIIMVSLNWESTLQASTIPFRLETLMFKESFRILRNSWELRVHSNISRKFCQNNHFLITRVALQSWDLQYIFPFSHHYVEHCYRENLLSPLWWPCDYIVTDEDTRIMSQSRQSQKIDSSLESVNHNIPQISFRPGRR